MPKKYTARKRRNAVDLYRRRNASRDPRTHMTLEQVAKLKRISSRTLRRWLDEDDRARERQPLAGTAEEFVAVASSAARALQALPTDDRLEALGYMRHAVEQATLSRLPKEPPTARAAVAAIVEAVFGSIAEEVQSET